MLQNYKNDLIIAIFITIIYNNFISVGLSVKTLTL